MVKLLTKKEAAGVLGLSTRKVDQLVQKGELPVIRLGKNVRIDVRELEHFVDRLKEKQGA